MENGGYLYLELEKHLPLKAIEVNFYEIDTQEDLSLVILKLLRFRYKYKRKKIL